MTKTLSFTVYGKAEGQGSTKAFMPKGAKFPIITSTNAKLKPWRQQIAGTALSVIQETGFKCITHGPVKLDAVFFFLCPKTKRGASNYKDTRTDLDKLYRGLGDSLTGIAFRDDAQIAVANVSKVYGETERTEVVITAL
jgi:Holliday junction resolvase RusA-like endonuclease